MTDSQIIITINKQRTRACLYFPIPHCVLCTEQNVIDNIQIQKFASHRRNNNNNNNNIGNNDSNNNIDKMRPGCSSHELV